MTELSDLILQLGNAKTSTKVSEVLPKLQAKGIEKRKSLNKLEEAREDAIFATPSARDKLRTQISETQEELNDCDAAIRVADRRLNEFRKNEFMADVEKRVTEARETNTLLRDDYVEIHKLASALGDRLRQAKERSIAIQNANAFIIAAKRPELKIIPVLSALARHLGVTTDMIGTGGSNFVHDPVKEFVLPEYYPRKPDKWQPRLAHLKDVEV